MFVLQNTPSHELKLPGITLSPFRFESNSVQFDLILTLVEGRDGIAGIVSYNTDLFDESTISEMVNRYQTLLQTVVEDPGQRIADVRLTTTDGLTRADFPRAEISQKRSKPACPACHQCPVVTAKPGRFLAAKAQRRKALPRF